MDFSVDPYIDDITRALTSCGRVILKAEPGSGKTTRVPLALLSNFKRILVVQPRRLAARLVAEWVAQQAGTPCGQLVGYQIRFENKSSSQTRLLFITEGLLTRKLTVDPMIQDFDLVILDEFHERHIHSDVALLAICQLQTLRPELKLMLMSATMDSSALEIYLKPAKIFDIPGRVYPVAVDFAPYDVPSREMPQAVALACTKMLADPRRGNGNILIFLEGSFEISQCYQIIKSKLSNPAISLITLTAETADNYRLLYQDHQNTKIILATNVAETSVTLPNIRGVIDCGRAKISGFVPWSGLPTLQLQKISQASCIQRAGRAGRTDSGVCYRLYSETDFNSRPPFTAPEIKRIDLCQTLLELHAMFAITGQDSGSAQKIAWFEAPDADSVSHAMALLHSLGAVDKNGKMTDDGRKMAQLPLHPRLGRVVLEGQKRGQIETALLASILISEGMVLKAGENAHHIERCDVCYQIDFVLAPTKNEGSRHLVDLGVLTRCRNIYESLRSICGAAPLNRIKNSDHGSIRRAVFAGFADRVAKYRPAANAGTRKPQRNFNFCLGKDAALSWSSVVQSDEWIVAIDARESLNDQQNQNRGTIYWASGIEKAWLFDDPFGLVTKSTKTFVDEKSQKVIAVENTLYGRLILDEQNDKADVQDIHDVLLNAVVKKWPESVGGAHELAVYHQKVALLDRHGIKHKLPIFTGELLDFLQMTLCEGCSSLGEVAKKDLTGLIYEQLDYDDISALKESFPDVIVLRNGKTMRIHYALDEDPWIEARIQDFFGVTESPKICRGRHAVVLKLLAPNYRPAQITSDLPGFWSSSYHDVKKDLKRRYPKHAWPDDPAHSEPPQRKK